MKYDNRILHGSALDQLKTLDSDSVDCCITSPPYHGLRDYKVEGQLGLEKNVGEYIQNLMGVFDEVKRVLKPTGSLWVNIGDSYNGNKSLSAIPARFQIAMIDRGWINRNFICWYKPNCMPSSIRDRFTIDWEPFFFFTKSQRYYFETQYEPMDKYLVGEKMPAIGGNKAAGYENHVYSGNTPLGSSLGRIKRCVWKIATQPFSEAHFATFPPALVKTPLLATCPEYICRNCGKAREKIIKPTGRLINTESRTPSEKYLSEYAIGKTSVVRTGSTLEYKEIGLTDCGCNAGFDGGIVLDPFLGSGTVALVALQNARNFIGCELSEEYIKMAMRRLEPYLAQTRLF